MTFRNALTILGGVIVVLLVLGLISTFLSQLLPVSIALVAGFALGRVSVRVDIVALLRGLLERRQIATAAPAQDTAKPAETQAKVEAEVEVETDPLKAEAEAIKARLSDAEAEAPEAPISDFDVKTEDEVLAQARRLEDEASKKAAEYDPSAALEERRRRLLGDQADES